MGLRNGLDLALVSGMSGPRGCRATHLYPLLDEECATKIVGRLGGQAARCGLCGPASRSVVTSQQLQGPPGRLQDIVPYSLPAQGLTIWSPNILGAIEAVPEYH